MASGLLVDRFGFAKVGQSEEEEDEDQVTIHLSLSSGVSSNGEELDAAEDSTPLQSQAEGSEQTAPLWTLDNLALPLSYVMVGTFQGLTSGVMTLFLLSINASEAQQVTIKTIRSMPAILKIVFGFLSDSLPIYGYRRKVYMTIGWVLSSFSMIGLIASGSNIPLIALFYFLFGLGFWMADVIADSIMVEKAKTEVGENRGKLSSLCYSYRFLANMITITIVTFAYDYITVSAVFSTLAVLPWLVMLPAIYYMHEQRHLPIASVQHQCNEIWTVVCSQAVWQPMAFVYAYQLFQIGNGAWTQYLFTSLHFTSLEINSFSVVAYVLLFLGVELYRRYMLTWNWRNIFISISALSVVLSINQILLLYQINRKIGISDYIFALGDEAFGDFLVGIQYLPTILMMTHLCPAGSEGASFAMFTTVNNSAMLLSSSISSMLLGVWDVSKTALEKGDISGMVKLTALTSCFQLFPIVFISYLPRGAADMKELSRGTQSRVGGGIFLAVILVSVLWVLVTGVLNILLPNWAGAS